MTDFVGTKIALFSQGKILVFLRDDNPGIRFPNQWDFFGGGREYEETPRECAIREIQEEIGVVLTPERFDWESIHPAVHDPNQRGVFLVAELTDDEVHRIALTEGQRWAFMDPEEFLSRVDAVEGMKERLSAYLSQMH